MKDIRDVPTLKISSPMNFAKISKKIDSRETVYSRRNRDDFGMEFFPEFSARKLGIFWKTSIPNPPNFLQQPY